MREETSAGGVVFKFDGKEIKVVLCYQKKISGFKTFCLPKGHIEKGETEEEAALREVLEETGISAQIMGFIKKISYTFKQHNDIVKKEVSFYLMKALSENFKPNKETEEIRWCTKKEALELDIYPTEQEVIREAFKLLKRSVDNQ